MRAFYTVTSFCTPHATIFYYRYRNRLRVQARFTHGLAWTADWESQRKYYVPVVPAKIGYWDRKMVPMTKSKRLQRHTREVRVWSNRGKGYENTKNRWSLRERSCVEYKRRTKTITTNNQDVINTREKNTAVTTTTKRTQLQSQAARIDECWCSISAASSVAAVPRLELFSGASLHPAAHELCKSAKKRKIVKKGTRCHFKNAIEGEKCSVRDMIDKVKVLSCLT